MYKNTYTNPRTGKIERATPRGRKRKVIISTEELRDLRNRMSINVMAEELGVSRATVYKYLHDAGLIGGGSDATKPE